MKRLSEGVEFVKSFLKTSKGSNLETTLAKLTGDLYVMSLDDPTLVREILDLLYKKRKETLIDFREVKVKGFSRSLKMFRPVGVLGVVPFTINLTQTTLEYAKDGKTLLDVGCGIGLTSIVAAKKGMKCTAIDISLLSVMTTRLNAVWNKVENNVHAVHADLQKFDSKEKFDIMTSNPPLDVATGISGKDTSSIYLKLVAGDLNSKNSGFAINYVVDAEGLTLFERMLQKSKKLLNKNGVIIISSGNINEDSLGKFMAVSDRYKFKGKAEWMATPYHGFTKMYSSEPCFSEHFIRNAVLAGIDVYQDALMKQQVFAGKLMKVEGTKYFFKGFSLVIKR